MSISVLSRSVSPSPRRLGSVTKVGAAVLTGAACALVLSGCSERTAPVEQPVGAPLDAPRVQVKNAGNGDKTLLVYKDLDAKQEADISFRSGFTQDVVAADRVKGFTSPTLKTTTTGFHAKATVDKATESDQLADDATRNVFVTATAPHTEGNVLIDSADGFQYGYRAQDSGRMTSIRLAAPQAASDEARSTMEKAIMGTISLPVVFPAEPVGKDATWDVDTRVAGEAGLLQTTTYHVTAIDGDVVTLEVNVAQRPSLGALAMEDGSNLEVLDSTTKAEGSIKVDLTKPLPVGGDVSATTQVVYGQDDAPVRVVQTQVSGWKFSDAR